MTDDSSTVGHTIVTTILGRKLLFFTPIIITLIFGIFYFVLVDRIYRASVTTIPSEVSAAYSSQGSLSELSGLVALAGVNLRSEVNFKDEALAILRSRAFLEEFLSESGALVAISQRYWPHGKRRGFLIFGERLPPSVNDAIEQFRSEMLSVNEDRFTGIIQIGIRWPNRHDSALWANKIVADLNAYMRKRAGKEATANLAYLERELNGTSTSELRQSLYSLIEREQQKHMIASVNEDFALKVLDPAVPPEFDDYISPKPIRVTLIASALGFIIGLTAVLISVMLPGPMTRA